MHKNSFSVSTTIIVVETEELSLTLLISLFNPFSVLLLHIPLIPICEEEKKRIVSQLDLNSTPGMLQTVHYIFQRPQK